jgi:hypothetical protein
MSFLKKLFGSKKEAEETEEKMVESEETGKGAGDQEGASELSASSNEGEAGESRAEPGEAERETTGLKSEALSSEQKKGGCCD